MKKRTTRTTLAILLLLACAPQVRGQDGLQDRDRGSMAPSPVVADAAVEDGGVQSLAEWWGRHKRALQYLSACALASASISYAFIVGIGNPVGGAVLGLIGASVMVAVCL